METGNHKSSRKVRLGMRREAVVAENLENEVHHIKRRERERMVGSNYFIEAIGLTKIYDNSIIALNNLTFSTKARILGLIGPNGAGKNNFC